MKHSWIHTVDHDLSGDENMRRDEEMALACEGDGIPRLRVYSWRPFTLSLGYGQEIGQIDTAGLERRGYGLVRRPTGGRAVFHAEEATYAVAMPSDGRGIHETYARINRALRRGLELLGATGVEFNRAQPEFRSHYTLDESASCFSVSALSELTWSPPGTDENRKLVGSAQRRYGGTLLQHGSILMGDAHLEIVDFLSAYTDDSRRDLLRARLASRTATLNDVFGGSSPSFHEVAEALRAGFAETFEGNREEEPVDSGEAAGR